MEIIDRDEQSGGDLVQIAFAETREEAALIRGLLREEGIRSMASQGSIEGPGLGTGLLARSPRRIYVGAGQASRARTILAETMVEDPLEAEIPEPANAGYLADATARRPRNYTLAGAYVRIWAFGFVALALAFAVFLVLR
ncbi:MAG TPA: DUF2007 domain-containing protein [Solirubrobacterales bacterium]|nr:DUF2007 domain-containing protein [Solirubrobacterales bacterium]